MRKLPQWYIDEPPVTWAERTILDAFFNLNTCRENSGGLGMIPWTAIVTYGDRMGFRERRLSSEFVLAIRTLDDAYLEWRRSQKRPEGTVDEETGSIRTKEKRRDG